MARSVENINEYIVSNLVTNFAAIGITINPVLWSKRNILRSICWTIAICQALLEQLQDLYKQENETIVSKAAAASTKWIQDKMFKFQYDALNPQVIALIDTVPQYPVVDPALCIITACSVATDASNEVQIKVAKDSPLIPLDSAQLAAAQSYINIIGVAGIGYQVISLPPDKLMVEADVFYSGQYAAIIQQSVVDTLNAYLENLSITNFNGALKMTDLEAVIRNVAGVSDVVMKNVRARADADAYSAGIDLILNTATIQKQFVTIAGYIAEETTLTKTFIDTLTFIPN